MQITEHLRDLAKETIQGMLINNENEVAIGGADGFVVIRGHKESSEGLIPLKSIEEQEETFTVCIDRR